MYSGVPAGASSFVASTRVACVPTLRTNPKSNSLAPNAGSTNTFSGFKSQWTKSRACAASTTARIAIAWRPTSSMSIGPGSSASRSASTGARTNSSTRYAAPSASRPRAYTAGTWGGPTVNNASASRSSASLADALSARATLIATCSPAGARSARNTAPKPPCPNVLTTRNPGRSGVGTT
jgi:hypothetical protein